MDARLARAREAHAAGSVVEAVGLLAEVVSDGASEVDVVRAAILVPPPVDPFTRARLHLLAAQAMTRVQAPALRRQLQERLQETRDHFRPHDELSPAVMDELARAGDRPRLLDAIAAFTGEAQSRSDLSRLHLLLASQALTDARFDAALSHVSLAGSLGGPGSDAAYLDPVVRFAVARHTGRGLDELLPLIGEAVQGLPTAARGWLALALMAAGRRAEATREWALLAPRADEVPPDAPEFLIATVGAAELCTWLGDRPTAERLHARLAPHAGRHAVAFATTPYEGPVTLALGRLARVLGRTGPAREHLRSAVAECRLVHAPVHEAAALVELARLEGSGTRARARETAAVEARTLGEAYGLVPLLADLAALETAPQPGPLTPREVEIAAIVATGATNAEIAARLFLSERTVENHVSRAMLKVGVSSRTGLALWMSRRADGGTVSP